MKARAGISRALALLLGNAAVLAVLLGLVWAGGELYYRFWFDSTDWFGLTKVASRWFERHYHYNGMHVRDDVDYALRKVDGRRRITFVGDSFTVGHGIAEVGDRFANRIRREHASQWEVHVLAQNGLDTGKELALLNRVARAGYEFDVVVLVYVLNDISDIVPEWQAIVTRIYRDQHREGFVLEHSYFANELYYQWKAFSDPDVANYYSLLEGAYQGEPWEHQKQRLKWMRDLCRAHGAQLLVVTFPLLHAVGPRYAYRGVHARLGELWADLSVPHLDLYDVYAPFAPEQLVIGRRDSHPSRFAHELAAQAIGAFLEQRVQLR